ncbi:hypothetical protein AB1Y20_017495 [Prymnesium parvum]|uniref:Uncharacterized protein n=1 Tax=Prymnesium parvum TaxID=97485 RepID=A0AB34JNG4_PRYPA|mmetsp:Transcript_37462/g.85857  ORF Transcript_37462/g.85857 Transcript_37462/m.85857 type:complete len:161 (-) Transcript_37462:452-934(-)
MGQNKSVPKEDAANGTAVSLIKSTVQMPDFARAEQIPAGGRPGGKWAKKPTPPGVLQFLESKGCVDLYKEFKAKMIKDGGGGNFFGWSAPKMQKVTEEFQPKFKAKGVNLYYCMGGIWETSGANSWEEWFYFVVFADIKSMKDPGWVPPELYTPGKKATW